ncbi:hypothetical protein ACH5RR_013014 [Cinchona calisaya]|uniref:Uncharacterized protein n=1 Tax=Cinchona calisaya TaxID=153742 RepID=A0ABD3A2H9_9GENT
MKQQVLDMKNQQDLGDKPPRSEVEIVGEVCKRQFGYICGEGCGCKSSPRRNCGSSNLYKWSDICVNNHQRTEGTIIGCKKKMIEGQQSDLESAKSKIEDQQLQLEVAQSMLGYQKSQLEACEAEV